MENKNMCSLIERMDRHMTHTDAMALNENIQRMLMEGQRVSSQSLIEFLTKYEVRKGPFIFLGYLQVYPTGKVYPSDEVYNSFQNTRNDFDPNSDRGLKRFDNFMDKVQNMEWNAPTGRAYKGNRSMAKNIFPYVLKLTTYKIHWQDRNTFAKKSAESYRDINSLTNGWSDELKQKMGIGAYDPSSYEDKPRYMDIGELGKYDISTFANKGSDGEYHPFKQEYYTDVDDIDSKVDYDRTAILNYMSNPKDHQTVYFGVNDDGTIDEIPKSLGQILHNTVTNWNRRLAAVTDPQELAQAKEYVRLMQKQDASSKTWLTQNIAYLCGTVQEIGESGSESVYWVNPNPLFLLEKGKTKDRPSFKYLFSNMSNDELQEILDRFAKDKADELNVIANPNI